MDVDSVWIPGHTWLHGCERCIQGKGQTAGFANKGSYGLWYKFPTTCAIVANSVGAARSSRPVRPRPG